MKYWEKLALLFTAHILTVFSALPQRASDIDLAFLRKVGEEVGVCDHVPHIQKIFNHCKPHTMLEFGLGFSTKFFLDSCQKVISVEFLTDSHNPHWLRYTIDLYREYKNWLPIGYLSNYNGDTRFIPYKYLGSKNLFRYETAFKQTALFSEEEELIGELQQFVDNLLKFNKIDLVLVDPPFLSRGFMVQLLFGKIPIIVANDCLSYADPRLQDVYGYRKIIPPNNYETFYIPSGKGTLVWIQKKKSNESLIEAYSEYVRSF